MSIEQQGAEVPPHVLEYLGERTTLTLATASPAGIPWASSLLYVNEGGSLYFWTKPETTTARHIAQNPLVSFAVDEDTEDLSRARGVQGSGECHVLLSGEEIARVASLFGDKFPSLSPGATMSISFFRLTVTEITYIDNRGAGASTRAAGEFGAEFHRERAFSVFSDLPLLPTESITAHLRPLHADAGEIVVREGGPAERFLIVVDGEVEVLRADGSRSETLGPGQLFGEPAIMRGAPRTATLRAVAPSTLLALGREEFLNLVGQALGTSGGFEKVIQDRLHALAGGA